MQLLGGEVKNPSEISFYTRTRALYELPKVEEEIEKFENGAYKRYKKLTFEISKDFSNMGTYIPGNYFRGEGKILLCLHGVRCTRINEIWEKALPRC